MFGDYTENVSEHFVFNKWKSLLLLLLLQNDECSSKLHVKVIVVVIRTVLQNEKVSRMYEFRMCFDTPGHETFQFIIERTSDSRPEVDLIQKTKGLTYEKVPYSIN